jgi:hypothetical protein
VKLVIAGNHAEYKDYLDRNKLSRSDTHYFNLTYQIMGITDPEVILVGSYKKRNNLQDLLNIARTRPGVTIAEE